MATGSDYTRMEGSRVGMEIVTVPYRPAPSTWGRLLLLVSVFAPVTLLALLPMGLGLNRYVITGDSMAPALQRGSVVLERAVPASDLRVGDVVTFHPPPAAGFSGPVTSRIVSIEPGAVRTQGDASPDPDPWALSLDEPTHERVVLELPYVGYFYLAVVHVGRWVGLAVIVVGLLALAVARELDRSRRTKGR